MNIPNEAESKVQYGTPGESLFTNTIVDAIQHPLSSTDIYPWAYSASLSNEWDERNFRSVANDLDLTASRRIAFGLFLSDSQLGDKAKEKILFSCIGSLEMSIETSAPIRVYPIFGRCNAGSIVQDNAAPANKLSRYIRLPQISPTSSGGPASSQYILRSDVKSDVLKIGYDSTAYPLFFGYVIENTHTATAYNIDYLQCSLQFHIWEKVNQTFKIMGI